jgi:hypothetical protein
MPMWVRLPSLPHMIECLHFHSIFWIEVAGQPCDTLPLWCQLLPITHLKGGTGSHEEVIYVFSRAGHRYRYVRGHGPYCLCQGHAATAGKVLYQWCVQDYGSKRLH